MNISRPIMLIGVGASVFVWLLDVQHGCSGASVAFVTSESGLPYNRYASATGCSCCRVMKSFLYEVAQRPCLNVENASIL